MPIFFLCTFFVAFFVAVILTPIVRALAPVLGLVDQPGERKVHHTPTPMGGGIAVFGGLCITTVFLVMLQYFHWVSSDSLAAAGRALTNNPEIRWQAIGIGVGATILFVTGLLDDRWNLSWKLRLGVQAFVAWGVTQCGVKATLFVAQPWIGVAITMLWIMVLTNALNFLDNMDGLSAGIGVVAALMSAAILLFLVRQSHEVVAAGLFMLSGALGGFLCWNRPPASIFMGDCGSNLIGFLLATLTVTGTFYESSGSRHVILAPLCILAVPLYDFVTVIWIRLRSGRSPFHGDKSHFSHRLVELGLRPSHAVLTIHLATLMTGLGGLLLYKVDDWAGAFLIIALICCVLSVIAILETVGRRAIADVQPTADAQDASPPDEIRVAGSSTQSEQVRDNARSVD